MSCSQEAECIQEALVEINNEMQLHEGAVAFVAFEEGIVYLQLQGTCGVCGGCGLLANLEQKLKSAVPDIKKVVVL